MHFVSVCARLVDMLYGCGMFYVYLRLYTCTHTCVQKVHTVSSMSSSDTTEWIDLEEKGAVVAKLKISLFCEKPANVKKCG